MYTHHYQSTALTTQWNNNSYIILKPPTPALQVSVNPDYLTARTKLGTQEFRENNKINSGSVMGLV